MHELHDLIFGVWSRGKLVMALGRTKCTHEQAQVVVGILDLANAALKPEHYFACDYMEGNNDE